MNKVAIMQPYFFPYLGYWQLISSVDIFVVYDDVNFIKGGWINRNRILINNGVHYINCPLVGASPNKIINDIEIDRTRIPKTLNKIREAYRKAPFYKETLDVIEKMMMKDDTSNLAIYLWNIISDMCDYLGIETRLTRSVRVNKDDTLKAEDKVVDICKRMNCDHYINAIGGVDLYHKQRFQDANIKLSFLKTDDIRYKQFKNDYFDSLSIIDVLMFNSVEEVREMLEKFKLIDPPE